MRDLAAGTIRRWRFNWVEGTVGHGGSCGGAFLSPTKQERKQRPKIHGAAQGLSAEAQFDQVFLSCAQPNDAVFGQSRQFGGRTVCTRADKLHARQLSQL